jgi:hypothetical protein
MRFALAFCLAATLLASSRTTEGDNEDAAAWPRCCRLRQHEGGAVPRSSYRGFLDFLLLRDTDGHEKAMVK